MKKQWLAAVIAAVALVGSGAPARAQSGGAAQSGDWKFEVTPYLWIVGLDGTVTVGDKEAEFDQSFSDLIENVDAAFEGIAVVQYRNYVGFFQIDTFAMSKGGDEFDQPPAQAALDGIDVDTTFSTLAAGYQFPGFGKGSRIDVLVGARFLDLTGEVTLRDGRSDEASKTVIDPTLVVRPSFNLTARLRFNPTLAIGGGGDSDLIYDLQPQFQYDFTPNIGARIGYRRLYYKYTTEKDIELETAFSGFLAGVSFLF